MSPSGSPPADRFSRPLRSLRVSVTDRCNFRCPYCMPASGAYSFLPRSEILSFEEIARLVSIFASLGVSKVRLTGGEPLLRADLDRLVSMLAAIPGIVDLALTTNGLALASRAAGLKSAGLSRVTVSLDSLDPEVFARLSGVQAPVARVLAGIEAALAAGLTPLKVNAVVERGVNDHTIVDLAKRFRGTGVTVRFIEYMDVGNANGWSRAQVVPAAEIVARISAELPLAAGPRERSDDVAERYRYADGSGEVGVVASVTRPFCGDCSRARLATDGRMITCLFAQTGPDLKGPMRAGAGDSELASIISEVWSGRTDRYSELRAERRSEGSGRKIEMFQVGG